MVSFIADPGIIALAPGTIPRKAKADKNISDGMPVFTTSFSR